MTADPFLSPAAPDAFEPIDEAAMHRDVALQDVVRLNRVLAREGVLDAFGHVSMRDPERSDRFFLARSCAPELVGAEDVLAFDMDAKPIGAPDVALYAERVIHSAIYKARPDVSAICHHHAPAILPFCLTDAKLRVVTQLGAAIGPGSVPVWDCRARFGATNHLVTTPEQAKDLAEALGSAQMVLMRRHGATVVAGSTAELAFRVIYSVANAENLSKASMMGDVDCFTDEEAKLAGQIPASSMTRAWNLWTHRAGV